MATTVKRISLSLTKEEQRELKMLCAFLGENQSQVIHRAISGLFRENKEKMIKKFLPDFPDPTEANEDNQ